VDVLSFGCIENVKSHSSPVFSVKNRSSSFILSCNSADFNFQRNSASSSPYFSTMLTLNYDNSTIVWRYCTRERERSVQIERVSFAVSYSARNHVLLTHVTTTLDVTGGNPVRRSVTSWVTTSWRFFLKFSWRKCIGPS
jgi:hypothetical protein